jgi:hypothetical protein
MSKNIFKLTTSNTKQLDTLLIQENIFVIDLYFDIHLLFSDTKSFIKNEVIRCLDKIINFHNPV